MTKLKLYVKVLIIFSILVIGIRAQEKNSSLPDACETIAGKFDAAMIAFQKDALPDSSLILVFRPTKGEKNSVRKRKIATAIMYLEKIHRFDLEKVIITQSAEGKTKLTYLDIYVNGKLEIRINLSKNGNLCFGIT